MRAVWEELMTSTLGHLQGLRNEVSDLGIQPRAIKHLEMMPSVCRAELQVAGPDACMKVVECALEAFAERS